MSADLEARLLASLPTVEAFAALGEQGIGAGSFHHWRALYEYIAELVGEHHHLPRLRDLKATFNLPDHIKRQPEEYDWLLLEFQRLTLAQQVQDVLDRTIESFGEDPSALVPALVRELMNLGGATARAVTYTDARSSERMDSYSTLAQQLEEAGSLLRGIPTGYSYFDAVKQLGWLPGELIAIVARLYMGKSWLLIWHGALAWQAGYRVLLLSPEMSRDEADARFDAIICGLRGVPVSATEMFRGFRPTTRQREIFAEVAKRRDWITMTTADGRGFRLTEIPRHIHTYQPDLVLIDGLPLISSDSSSRGSSVWEQMKDLAYGLKNIAEGEGVPIICTHQATRGAHDSYKPPELHELAYSDAVGQASDRVLTISRTKNEELQRRVTIQKFRKGNPLHGGMLIHFDPEHGIIKEVPDDLPSGARSTRRDGAADKSEDGASEVLLIS